jgi:4-hydroxybenzoate polyprenyltransferase
MAWFSLGAIVMRAAGCVINDLWDKKLDAQVERTKLRPLASGALSVEQALIFLSMLLMGGLIVLLVLSSTTITLGLLVIPLIILYPLTKRFIYWPQAILGLTFNFGALMGWAAVTDSIGLSALLLYCAGVAWTLGYDTIYAHQDKEDDALIGIKSTALLLGERSKIWVSGFYGAAMMCIVLAFIFSGAALYCYAVLLAAAGHLFWQVWRWDIQEPHSALRIFKSNRDFALIVFVGALVAAFLA